MPSVQPSQGTPSRRPSSVRPTIWWPGTSGSFGSGSSPSTTWRSVRQTPQADTRRRTWPGPGSGTGTSSSRSGSPAAWSTIARIADIVPRSHVRCLTPSRVRKGVVRLGIPLNPAAVSQCGHVRVSDTETCPVGPADVARTGGTLAPWRRTLPYSWYTDPEILRREQERIFAAEWQYVGHTGQLAEPGYFATARRPHARRRHTRPRRRAPRLRQRLPPPRLRRRRGRGSAARRCSARTTPGRTGSTAGSAQRRAATRSRTSRRTSSASCPSPSDTWGPFVFANARPEPEPLADALGSLPAQVAELGLDVDSLVHHSRWEAEVEANWKIVSENFLECYHCQVAHPGFSEVVDVSSDAYVLSTDGTPLDPARPAAHATPEDELPRAQFHFLWPNLGINIFGGRPNISIGPIVPLTPERTYRFLDYFFGPDVDQAWIDDLLAFDDQVGREDACSSRACSAASASGALEHGVVMGRSEQLDRPLPVAHRCRARVVESALSPVSKEGGQSVKRLLPLLGDRRARRRTWPPAAVVAVAPDDHVVERRADAAPGQARRRLRPSGAGVLERSGYRQHDQEPVGLRVRPRPRRRAAARHQQEQRHLPARAVRDHPARAARSRTTSRWRRRRSRRSARR